MLFTIVTLLPGIQICDRPPAPLLAIFPDTVLCAITSVPEASFSMLSRRQQCCH